MALGLGLKLGLGGAGFSPLSVNDLTLWLDAADTSSITDTSGAVTRWADKSGNGNHADNNTGSREPITGTTTMNGLNTITANGSVDSYLQVVNNIDMSDVTFFAVLRNERTYPSSSVLDLLFRHDSTPLPLVSSYNGFVDNTAPAIRQEDLSGDLYLDGVSVANDTNFTVNTDVIFAVRSAEPLTNNIMTILGRSSASFPWSHLGRVGEMAFYNRQISDAEMNLMGNHLSAKWGASWTNI